MPRFKAAAVRIIPVFARGFGFAIALLAATIGSAQAQSTSPRGFTVRMGLDFKGGTYQVAPTTIPADLRSELPVNPAGNLRVYVRAIALPGVDGQGILDVQVFQPQNGTQAQLTSFTMPVYLAADNSTSMKTLYGDLAVRAYVDAATASSPPPPGQPALQAATPPKPVYKPVDDAAPVRPQAIAAPLPSPLPPPTP